MADVVRDYLQAEVEKLTGRPWRDTLEELYWRTRRAHPEFQRADLTKERELELLRRAYLHESVVAACLERDAAALEGASDLMREADHVTRIAAGDLLR